MKDEQNTESKLPTAPRLGTPDTPRVIFPRWWKDGECDVQRYRPSNGVCSCVYDSVYIKVPRWVAKWILRRRARKHGKPMPKTPR